MVASICTEPPALAIRPAQPGDADALWAILQPVIRAGETYPLPRDMGRAEALEYWLRPEHAAYVAEQEGAVLGTYYLRPNQSGGGAHVANCGYMTAGEATGRGIARAMCLHSLAQARARGYRAMQFNFVISTNHRAVRLWRSCGFTELCRLPAAFRHPYAGDVDALVMYQVLDPM
ncbi:MAG: GNAT family N-acetyltransferase [Rhodospirillales bacterium 20-64-7]|nr:MAG: GNAT family N-acetyltransferase [Rhodospirillales bacterium 20-64-7]